MTDTDYSLLKSNLNESFTVSKSDILPESNESIDFPTDISLKLVKTEEKDWEVYESLSLLFHSKTRLPQNTYKLSSEKTGDVNALLVPIGKISTTKKVSEEDDAFIYNTVFTRMKKDS